MLGSRASVVPAKLGSAGIIRELMLGSCMGRPALAASKSAPLAEGSWSQQVEVASRACRQQ